VCLLTAVQLTAAIARPIEWLEFTIRSQNTSQNRASPPSFLSVQKILCGCNFQKIAPSIEITRVARSDLALGRRAPGECGPSKTATAVTRKGDANLCAWILSHYEKQENLNNLTLICKENTIRAVSICRARIVGCHLKRKAA